MSKGSQQFFATRKLTLPTTKTPRHLSAKISKNIDRINSPLTSSHADCEFRKRIQRGKMSELEFMQHELYEMRQDQVIEIEDPVFSERASRLMKQRLKLKQ